MLLLCYWHIGEEFLIKIHRWKFSFVAGPAADSKRASRKIYVLNTAHRSGFTSRHWQSIPAAWCASHLQPFSRPCQCQLFWMPFDAMSPYASRRHFKIFFSISLFAWICSQHYMCSELLVRIHAIATFIGAHDDDYFLFAIFCRFLADRYFVSPYDGQPHWMSACLWLYDICYTKKPGL